MSVTAGAVEGAEHRQKPLRLVSSSRRMCLEQLQSPRQPSDSSSSSDVPVQSCFMTTATSPVPTTRASIFSTPTAAGDWPFSVDSLSGSFCTTALDGLSCTNVKIKLLAPIRIVLYDFELDVKRAGRCHEYLQISALDARRGGGMTPALDDGNSVDGRIYFRDCGSLGKQTLSIDASEVMVRFKTGQASLAQRGFLLYFEGTGTKQ